MQQGSAVRIPLQTMLMVSTYFKELSYG
jgi:hypothetical protein